ncbi:MAG: HAD hydrolase-like protein [Bythopirellula sp.]|nr:HAD hydrolase-like protein [Bythopirellula sp.]
MTIILFDIDGTLISTGGAGKVAFAETFHQLFGVCEISSNVGFAGRSDRAIAEELMRVHDIEITPENWQRFTTAFLPRLKQVLPRSTGEILPGVLPLLDELADMENVAIGLLTGNIAAGAKAKLLHYQLFDRFQFGGYGDDWTDRCDIAVAALNAAKLHLNGAGQGGDKVIVIGDTPADVRCARAINAYAVAVATGGATMEQLSDAKPDLLVADLTDDRELLLQVDSAIAN